MELTEISKRGRTGLMGSNLKAKKHQLAEKGSYNQTKRDYAFAGQLIKPSGNTFTEGIKPQIS